jgi:hypothetical protein
MSGPVATTDGLRYFQPRYFAVEAGFPEDTDYTAQCRYWHKCEVEQDRFYDRDQE